MNALHPGLSTRTSAVGTGLSTAARIAAALALACMAIELLVGPGYRWAWWGLGPAFQAMRWTATAAGVVFVLAVVLMVVAGVRHARSATLVSALAAVLSLAAAGPPAYLWREAQQVPRIHDISTDTEHPPVFVDVVPLRREARNPMTVDPATLAEQKRAYPQLHPAMLALPPAQALQLAERTARSMGWDIVAVSPADGRIEATATTLLFGFKDDVVIRVAPQGSGSRVDLRSLSRVGGSDLGTNARRVDAFVKKLEAGAG